MRKFLGWWWGEEAPVVLLRSLAMSYHIGKVPVLRRDEDHLCKHCRSRGVYRDTVNRDIHPDVPNSYFSVSSFLTSNPGFM